MFGSIVTQESKQTSENELGNNRRTFPYTTKCAIFHSTIFPVDLSCSRCSADNHSVWAALQNAWVSLLNSNGHNQATSPNFTTVESPDKLSIKVDNASYQIDGSLLLSRYQQPIKSPKLVTALRHQKVHNFHNCFAQFFHLFLGVFDFRFDI